MRLADFIEQNAEEILSASESFTATLMPAARHLDAVAMRDHLPVMLDAIVADLRSEQSADAQKHKSLGQIFPVEGADDTPAQIHAILRAKSGFNIQQVVSEYRALRASVLCLWMAPGSVVDTAKLDDMVRFNEAIDQALAESVASFSTESDHWRHIFLAVLGHDLRGPLNAVLLTAEVLGRMGTQAPIGHHAQRLIRSGRRMQELLDSLLDYSRTSLGVGIGIVRTEIDLATACEEELDILRTALPGRTLELHVAGATTGRYDASRIREVLSNLVYNAAKYSEPGSVIRVALEGSDKGVDLSVENAGASITPAELQSMFEPLRRGKVEPTDASSERANLGLGLFIVNEIAKAHGGDVRAVSNGGKTRFTMTLPAGG